MKYDIICYLTNDYFNWTIYYFNWTFNYYSFFNTFLFLDGLWERFLFAGKLKVDSVHIPIVARVQQRKLYWSQRRKSILAQLSRIFYSWKFWSFEQLHMRGILDFEWLRIYLLIDTDLFTLHDIVNNSLIIQHILGRWTFYCLFRCHSPFIGTQLLSCTMLSDIDHFNHLLL